MKLTLDLFHRGLAAAALHAGHAYAASDVAQGVIATGSGRGGAVVAGAASLLAVVMGVLALTRPPTPPRSHRTRDKAIVALVLGLVGIALAGLHLATSSGGLGTGNGRGGAIVALLLGVVATGLGRAALARSGLASGDPVR